MSYPPFSYLDKHGELRGYLVDIARAAAAAVGLEPVFVATTWNDAQRMVLEGEADALFSIAFSPARARRFDFSPPHTTVHYAIFAHEDAPPVSDLEHVPLQDLVLQELDITHEYFKELGNADQIALVNDTPALVETVDRGERQYTVVAYLAALYWIKELHLDSIQVTSSPILSYRFRFAVRKGNHTLLDELSAGVAVIQENEELEAIRDHWLSPLEHTGVAFGTVLGWIALIIAPLLLVTVGMVLWSYTLRRQVAERTATLEREVRHRGRAEELARQQRDLAQLYLDVANTLILALDRRGRITLINRKGLRVFEAEGENLLGLDWFDEFVPEPHREELRQKYLSSLGRGFPEVLEVEIVTRSSETRLITWYLATVLDEWGRAAGVLSSGVDVTDLRREEQEHRETEYRYRILAQSFPTGLVLILDSDLRYLLVEGSGMQKLGFDRTDLLGKTVEDLWPEELAATLKAHYLATLAGERRSFEVSDRGHDFEVNTVPLIGSQGDPQCLAVAVDITSRKRMEEERERLNMELRRSNRELEQFAYVASHDLQEPLRTITSYIELIRRRYRDQLDERGQTFMDFAVDGAARMKALIEALLQYSRVGTRGKPLEPADLNEIVAGALRNVETAIQEAEASVDVSELPRVLGDSEQLELLFQNLFSNALKFRGAEPARIALYARSNGTGLAIGVQDNGIGIEPRHQERIFQVFQRLHGMAEYPGTGIGLAICKRIVERHGGEIWVESAVGEGSTFLFTLQPAKETES